MNTEDNNTFVFIVDVKDNKHQIDQTGCEEALRNWRTQGQNLIRPDGEKEAHVQLAAEYDALNVANKSRII